MHMTCTPRHFINVGLRLVQISASFKINKWKVVKNHFLTFFFKELSRTIGFVGGFFFFAFRKLFC